MDGDRIRHPKSSYEWRHNITTHLSLIKFTQSWGLGKQRGIIS